MVLSGCGTIIGGSSYNAHVHAVNRPNANIYHKGKLVGKGFGVVKIRRVEADKIQFSVVEEGCPEEIIQYRTRTFRGWACFFSIVGWTGFVGGIPIPWGMFVDLVSGAWWKPTVGERGIMKLDFKNYQYNLPTEKCEANSPQPAGGDKVFLKNGSIISGKIVEEIPGTSIRIITRDGSEFVYKVEEIEKITH